MNEGVYVLVGIIVGWLLGEVLKCKRSWRD